MKRLFTILTLVCALAVEAQIVNTNGLQVTAATNTANYFIGNGAGLTNVPGIGVTTNQFASTNYVNTATNGFITLLNATNVAAALTNQLVIPTTNQFVSVTAVTNVVANFPQVINTNFIDGKLYTNNYGTAIQVVAMVKLSSSYLETVGEALRIAGNTTNFVSIVDDSPTALYVTTTILCGFVPNGAAYAFTNTYVAGDENLSGGQILIP
jgi:hypothetical protein